MHYVAVNWAWPERLTAAVNDIIKLLSNTQELTMSTADEYAMS